MKTRWHRRTILLEAARSGAALLAAGFLSLLQPLLSPWQLLLLPLVVLFAVSFLSCIVRAVSEISVDEEGILLTRGFLPARRLDWSDVTSIEVRIFPLGRYRKATLADFKVRGRSGDMLIDDGLEGFRDVLDQAWREARARGMDVSDLSRTNLAALGLAPSQER
jgi:hypothetical protein